LKNKFVILYYSGNDLKVASFVSPGKKGYRTPKRKYKSNFKEVVHFSKQYNNYPMPFSVHSGQG
jgi:lysophospholipase L1-like esterase